MARLPRHRAWLRPDGPDQTWRLTTGETEKFLACIIKRASIPFFIASIRLANGSLFQIGHYTEVATAKKGCMRNLIHRGLL